MLIVVILKLLHNLLIFRFTSISNNITDRRDKREKRDRGRETEGERERERCGESEGRGGE